MKRGLPFSFLILALLSVGCMAADSTSFRGNNRDGVYQEKGLLKSWPEEGPKEMWAFQGLGEGYASVAIHKGTIYTVGKEELEGFLFAIDSTGKLKWKVAYGAETDGGGFPGSRSTPTIDGTSIYITSGTGRVMAFHTKDGRKLWEVDFVADFNGTPPRFSYSESVLVNGDHIIATPGGDDIVVALNKNNGETVWKAKAKGEEQASYCSARLYEIGKTRQLITLSSERLFALNPATGETIWDVAYPVKYGIHANAPVLHGNILYVSDGYKGGGRAFQLAADGKSIKELWKEEVLDVHHGGLVRLGGYVYGAASNGTWHALNLETGELKAQFRDLGKGSVVSADGLLYGYDEKGFVGLVNPDPNNFKVISKFQITKGSSQHWGHPVINDGRLYIRHGDVLMCYNIKAS